MKGLPQAPIIVHNRGDVLIQVSDRRGSAYSGSKSELSHLLDPSFPYGFKSQNHRMVVAGRDLCESSSPSPLPKQGHLEQAAQDLVQAAFKYLQRRRLYNLSGQVRMHMHSPCTPALGKTLVEPLTHLTPASPPVRSGFEDRHCSCPSACWPRPPLAPAAALRPPLWHTVLSVHTHTAQRARCHREIVKKRFNKKLEEDRTDVICVLQPVTCLWRLWCHRVVI